MPFSDLITVLPNLCTRINYWAKIVCFSCVIMISERNMRSSPLQIIQFKKQILVFPPFVDFKQRTLDIWKRNR